MRVTPLRGRLQYFLSLDEIFILMIPVVGIAFALIQFVFFRHTMDSIAFNINKLIISTVLLNTIHVVFPFVLLAVIPSWRQLAWQKVSPSKSKKNAAMAITVLIVLLIFSLISVAGAVKFPEVVQKKGEAFLVWVFFLVPVFHGIRQSAGFSLLMSRGLMDHVTETEKKDLQNFMKVERQLQWGVNIGTLTMLTSTAVSFGKVAGWDILFISGAAVAFSSALGILIFVARRPSFQKTNKLVFALRYLLWPISAFTFIGGWFVMLMHGTEYVGLCRRVIRKSVDVNLQAKLVGTLLFAVAMVIVYCIFDFVKSLPDMPLREIVSSSYLLTFILALFPMLVLGHYIVDAIIYRMSDAEVAKVMKPALVGLMESQYHVAKK
jgi:hypothetical protein